MSLPESISNLIIIRTKRGKVDVDAVKQIARIAYMQGLATRNKERKITVRKAKQQPKHATKSCRGGRNAGNASAMQMIFGDD